MRRLPSRRPINAVIGKPASGRTMSGDEAVERHWRIESYSSTSGVFLLR